MMIQSDKVNLPLKLIRIIGTKTNLKAIICVHLYEKENWIINILDWETRQCRVTLWPRKSAVESQKRLKSSKFSMKFYALQEKISPKLGFEPKFLEFHDAVQYRVS